MGSRIATAVWLVCPDLLLALDERLGPPGDSYVNGSQVWLTDDGPGGATLEWRLHPAPGYSTPRGLSIYDVWDSVVDQLSGVGPLAAVDDGGDPIGDAASGRGSDSAALTLGSESCSLTSLWEGLECYPASGDEPEPAPLSAAATEALGIPPDRSGLVDHDAIGDEWERSDRAASIVALLLAQLTP